MKLSALVHYLNHLDGFRPESATQTLIDHIDPVLHTIENHDLQFPEITRAMIRHRWAVHQNIAEVTATVDRLKQEIKHSIESLEHHYLAQSYELYSEGMRHDSDQYMLDRRFNLGPDAESYLRARLLRYADWHHAGMILRPGQESWIQDLVSLDPMYLVDVRLSMLEPCREKFTPQYQRRLRCYAIQESTEHAMLTQLPQHQMGLILAYNFFHYKPLELVRCFISELYQLIKPGGTLVFTFNDCDRYGGVELAERCYMCYTPGRLVLASAEMTGFEISHVYHIDAAATWVELRRPGDLESRRGGQALARIIAKSQETQYNSTSTEDA